ncbi:MAG: hypothetical protein AB1529_05610 [Candidatus Micrarchaeota archaeon]
MQTAASDFLVKKVPDLVYHGLWALFLFSVAAVLLTSVAKIDKLPYLVENFHADSYDTMLSVKFFSEFGPFGNVPYYSGPYRLFGYFPLLFAALASLLNYALNDVSLSTTMLYWMTDIAMAALLWEKFLKKCDWKVRALFVAFFLVNLIFGNLFPLGFRKRQQLAVLLGMIMFLNAGIAMNAALGFAALLAQPFTGAAIVLLRAAEFIGKREFRGAALMLGAAALAYPFYAGLISATFLEPAMPGCGLLTNQQFFGLRVLFFVAVLAFYLANMQKRDLLLDASLVLAAFYPVSLMLFLMAKDFLPLAAAQKVLYVLSMPCSESMFQAAALGIVAFIYLRNHCNLTRPVLALLLFMSVLSLNILETYLLEESTVDGRYQAVLGLLQDLGLHRIKTAEVVVSQYSGTLNFLPTFTLFPVQGYAMLRGYNVTFVDEFNLPPQISRGMTNVYMFSLPKSIYEEDIDSCRATVAGLKGAGVEGLIFLIGSDMTLPPDFDMEKMLDDDFLSRCGLKKESLGSGGSSIAVLYSIK